MGWGGANAPKRIQGRASQARRAKLLARSPYCALCSTRRSTVADHIINLARGGIDHESNMQALCTPCHAAKTAQEAALGVAAKAQPQGDPAARPSTQW